MKTCIVILCLFTSPAIGQSSGEKAGFQIAPTTAEFVKEAASSDMLEIESSRLAAQQGNAQTKIYADQMISDHSKTSSELRSLAGAVGAEMPSAMRPAHERKLAQLKVLKGAAFDKQYFDDQVLIHNEAVSLFQRYAKGGDNDALKTWAGKTEPTLEHHLQMAENLGK
jgi:putative membrane protein